MPSLASSRKQIRQRPKSRIYPCRRPQRKQRFTARVLYLGVFWERAIVEVFAIGSVPLGISHGFFSKLPRKVAQRETHGLPKSLHILADGSDSVK